jgi:TonB family protein
MKNFILIFLTIALVCCDWVRGATSDWISAPKPKFPQSALKNGSEGAVILRMVIKKDGAVAAAKVVKSSGDRDLDVTAQRAVLKWRLNPRAIKPADLTTGRDEVITFKQEALVAAVYPDRKAYFTNWGQAKLWMYAPFPSYPLEERELHHTGRALVYGRIDSAGRVTDVKLLQSSGFGALDKCAVAAVRLWRAHKQYAGQRFKVPIDFVM